MTVEELREEAREKLAESSENMWMRSRWNCNPAHVHLKKSKLVITCFQCGHWFYKGEDITQDEEDEDAND